MLSRDLLLALASAGLISALPLNINLGAYSPALVVGDGEISFGGAQNAGELMSTLASGAATAGAQAAAAPEGGAQAAAVTPPAIAGLTSTPQPAEGANAAVVDTTPGSDILPENPQASVVSPDEATTSDPAASMVAGMISKGMEPSLKTVMPHPNMAKRNLPPRAPAADPIAHSFDALVGREADLAAATEKLRLKQRTFAEALNYAITAAQNQPEIELGTGVEGSGVGVIVNPGKNVAAGTPAAGRTNGATEGVAAAAPAAAKRYVQPGAPMGANAAAPKSGITLMAIAEI